jgi:hypothetical protein
MSFARLNRGDWIAFVAALALLLFLPMTWYTTKQAEQLRRDSTQFLPQVNNDLTPSPSKQASQAAAAQEKNAYRAHGVVDRLALIALLAAAGCALAAAFLRASGRRFESGLTPSALASYAALLGCVLVAFRIIHPPGLQAAAVVKPGAPLALVAAGALALGARIATLRERTEPAAEPAAADPATASAQTPDAVA